MGTTFTNLQIRVGEQEVLEYSFSTDFRCIRTAQEWFTVYEENGCHDFERMKKLGRKISKIIDFPIMVVSYFDDDEFEMHLLRNGKTAGFYRNNFRGIMSEKTTAFIKEMEFTKEEATAFRYLLKKEMNVQDSIDAFSRLLGVQLYTDLRFREMIEVIWCKDTESVLAEIAAEKKSNKVKNQTVLELRDEILGFSVDEVNHCTRVQDMKDRVIRFVPFDGTNDFSHVRCYQEWDGRFEEIYDYQYPREIFTENDFKLWLEYDRREIFIWDKEGYGEEEPEWEQYEPILSAMKSIPKERKRAQEQVSALCRWHSDLLLIDEYEFFYRRGQLRKIDWTTSGPCYTQWNIVAEYQYEKMVGAYWADPIGTPVFVDDMLVVMRIVKSHHVQESLMDVRFFDRELRLLRKERVELYQKLPSLFSFTYDKALDTVFLGKISVNLTTREVRVCSVPIEGGYVLACLDARKNVFVWKGNMLYVLNSELELISKHQFKGSKRCCYVNENGNLCLITENDFVEQLCDLKADAGIRIYEVKMKG